MAINGYYNTWTVLNNVHASSYAAAKMPQIVTPNRSYPLSVTDVGFGGVNNQTKVWQEVATSMGATLDASKKVYESADRLLSLNKEAMFALQRSKTSVGYNYDSIKEALENVINNYNHFAFVVNKSGYLKIKIKEHLKKKWAKDKLDELGLSEVFDGTLTVNDKQLDETLNEQSPNIKNHLRDLDDIVTAIQRVALNLESMSGKDLIDIDKFKTETYVTYNDSMEEELHFPGLGYVFDKSY